MDFSRLFLSPSSPLHSSNMSFLRLAVRNVARPRMAFAAPAALATRSRILQGASYSAAAGLSKEQITARDLDVLKGFEKVKQDKVRTVLCRRMIAIYAVA